MLVNLYCPVYVQTRFLMVPGVTCTYAIYATILRTSLNDDAGYADITNNAMAPYSRSATIWWQRWDILLFNYQQRITHYYMTEDYIPLKCENRRQHVWFWWSWGASVTDTRSYSNEDVFMGIMQACELWREDWRNQSWWEWRTA
jgi:hypothetical protein